MFHSLGRIQHQSGFLLPLAIFLLVAMSVMALALSRMTASSNLAVAQEVISVQSFYAAESGAQRAMSQLFFPDDSSRQAIDGRCAAMNITLNFATTGLNQCSATVVCSCRYDTAANCDATSAANYEADGPVASSFYQLLSTGQCTIANVAANRTIEVEAYAN
ncbi:pilus assembly PilX N-terminal domain-containing protein [Gilvimarinus sp. SDUM040013]|uniref:Pilus assembly PilX N-terminal domain-containing protein n=1 Tax=Gilvimarinus gilvus TaxID=3058038 RepID=A0ABU4RS58_9GAMM|nr:pilus assembly PilX N-terminal domain-containing protein [Gilvimarinus sp. SDUM040013]MDO3388170.1 pilus assembly PilX N-terminal domain-containing protein [Gilvimarinus sp. SDUM040013]MDX6847720.1 pilus assembly PilX N-terminal domain-containing protein [Gilvimarinus sp. SDUM040013]